MTETLGMRLAQARREMGVRERRDITRGEVAEAAGVDPSTVSLWEADKKSPREEALAKLAKFLRVTPAYLRYGVTISAEQLPGARKLTEEELDRADAIAARAKPEKATPAPTKRRATGGK